ncbi:MAG: hypothetical protein CMJ49_07685 [Planctomycetaceae bacterium]|nr:hypothetical protein [Planctomycetaceae bacterium]
MGPYGAAAEFHDLLYSEEKDYASDAAVLGALIRDVRPDARRVLDVACGTGTHAQHLTAAGLTVERRRNVMRKRGVYIGRGAV